MSLDLFTIPLTNVTVESYRVVSYSQAMTGINPISFMIPSLDEFVDLGCSYLEVELKLNLSATNSIIAYANSALYANNTNYVYVQSRPWGLQAD